MKDIPPRKSPYTTWFMKFLLEAGLNGDIEHLSTSINPVGGIDLVWAHGRTVRGIGRQLRCCKAMRATTFAAALFGLFAFWLAHG